MRIIESDNDGFEFERAFISAPDGHPVPVAIMGGVECLIETKPGPLLAGLAFCQPLNSRLANDWLVSVVAELDDGAGPRRIWNMTADPKVVAAARKFHELEVSGLAAPGADLS